MNKLLPSVLVCWVVAAAPALALTADQKVTAVTVYPDRALVTRSGEVKLDSGVQAVVFENLPANLEEDSVRAKASSAAKLKILGVEVRRDYKEVKPSAATQQLQDAMTKLDDQIRVLTDEKNDLQRRNQFLDEIRDKTMSQTSDAEGKNGAAMLQNVTGLFQLYGTEISKITTREQTIDISLRDLNKQKDGKAGQLSLLQQPAQPNTRSAIVTVDAGDGGSANLQVTYMMPGAGWQPQYDAYADPDTQKVELTYYGVVRQSTGEDWNDVALTLSSARPSTAARLPDLAAWIIDLGNPAFAVGGNLRISSDYRMMAAQQKLVNSYPTANGSAALAQLTADADAPAATPASPAPADAELQTAEIHSLGPAATFVVPARTSIPNDSQPHRSAISVQTLQGQWTYEATPKLVPAAFLKTKVTNTSGGPLLGGEINAFLGNTFIGKSSIGLVAANATFDLFLGPDDNIKVTRTEGVKKEETGGLLTRLKIYKRSFTIELQNFKSTTASFKLRDQLPVSKNEQVNVVVDQAAPAFTSHDEDTGEVNWEIKLKPNEKQKITVEYEIDVPPAQSVAGI